MRPRKFTDEEAISLWGEGYSDCKIARILGVHPQAIFIWRKRNGIPPNNSARKLTDNEKIAIRELHFRGFNDCEIARLLRRHHITIKQFRKSFSDIAIGKTICSVLKCSLARFKPNGYHGSRKGRKRDKYLIEIAIEEDWYQNYLDYCIKQIEEVEKITGLKLGREW
jgi:hypothetical protein